MTAPRFARLAARVLELAGRGDMPSESPSSREQGIAAIARALEERKKQAARRTFVARVAIAAATLLAVAGSTYFAIGLSHSNAPKKLEMVARAVSGGVHIVHNGMPSEAHETGLVEANSTVVSGDDGRADFVLSTGTRLHLGSNSEFAVVEKSLVQRFSLHKGAVQAKVAKLKTGERFIIDTHDAEVEVHGTSFEVSVADQGCASPQTRVRVFEGIVTVRSEDKTLYVTAGQHWEARCEPTAQTPTVQPASSEASPTAASLPATQPSVPAERPRSITERIVPPRPASARDEATGAGPPPSAPEAAPPPSIPPAPSLLAQQNDEFADAVALRRTNHSREAARSFAAFIARYPNGPLTESAAVERMKLLRTFDPGQARNAAEQYLRSYPHGFAREEASAILQAQ